MESLAEEVLRDVLLRLPTRDVASGRCVSRQWRGLLMDPSFVKLHAHATHIVSGARAEAVLVTETRPPGNSPETTVFNISTGNKNHLCCVAGLAPGYSPANICNGFLCLVAPVDDLSWQPVFLCNPITEDMLQVPPPPTTGLNVWYMYAMGHSLSTREYKLFRLSFSVSDELTLQENMMDVLTLGGGGGGLWRRHDGLFGCHGMDSPPALSDGKLYVMGKKRVNDRKPNRLLVVNVESETHHTYSLPRYNAKDGVADVFELHGRPCIAVHELGPRRRRLCFWVIQPQASHGDDRCWYLPPVCWELRYIFDMGMTSADIISRHHHPRAAWLCGDDGMLCYLYRDSVYKYDTTEGRRRQHSVSTGYSKGWDYQHSLLSPNDGRWDVLSGYRPNLLSPHDLAIVPQQDEERFRAPSGTSSL